MKVILVTNLKGGVGKSTISINLAHSISAFKKTAILDYDTQRSIKTLITSESIKVFTKLDEVDKDTEYLIIDTPSYLSDKLVKLVHLSNIVIIPTLSSITDYLPTINTYNYINDHRKQKTKCFILINQVDKRSTLSDDLTEQLKNENVELLDVTIPSRTMIKKSLFAEKGIFSTSDRISKDAFELLTKAIILNIAK